ARTFLSGTGMLLASSTGAFAAQKASLFGLSIGTVEVIQGAVFIGAMGAALLSAIWLIRERARIAADNVALRARIADLNAALQRSEVILNMRDQRVVIWPNDNRKPELVGNLPPASGAPDERAAFL